MHNALLQRDSFNFIHMTIGHNGVHLSGKKFFRKRDHFIPFENISSKAYSTQKFRQWAIILTMIAGVFVVIALLVAKLTAKEYITLLLYFLVPLLIMWFTRKKFVGFGDSDSAFAVRASRPSRKEVQEFLEELRQTRITYLRKTYFETMKSASLLDDLRNLVWLRQQDVISQDEFEQRKREVELSFSSSETTDGPITLYYQGSKKDILAIAKYVANNNQVIKDQLHRGQVGSVVITCIMLVGLIYMIDHTASVLNLAIMVIITGIISYFLYGYMIKYSYAKRVIAIAVGSTEQSTISRNTAVSVYDDGIAISSDASSGKLLWPIIQKIDDDKTHVYIVLPGANVIAVPNTAFNSAAHRQEFLSTCRSHIQA